MYTTKRPRAAAVSRVLLADDQAIFRAGIARVLAGQEDITVLDQCSSPQALLELVASSRSCILLLAQSMQADMDRVFAATHATATRVILMTDSNTKPAPAIMRRLDGLLTRQTSAVDLLACVRNVSNGDRVLTSVGDLADSIGERMREMLSARELQIIGFVVQGLKNRQIAGEIGTTEQVVKNYLRSIYDKTGSSDRLELALFTLHHRTLAEAAARAADTVPERVAQV
ncbi:MAG: response regulator transcription factor [Janthinobacterium lividum]